MVRELVAGSFVFVLAFVIIALGVNAHRSLSLFDEMVHYDYLYKLTQGHLLVRGDKISMEAMREESCRGVDVRGLVIPPCGGPYVPDRYQELGFNTADSHPPLYYFVTGKLAQAAVRLHVVRTLFVASRLMGGVWLGAGLVLLMWAGALLGASLLARIAVSLLILGDPTVTQLFSIINPDSTSFFATGLVLGLALLWESRRRWLWLLPVSAALAVLLSEVNSLGVFAVATYLGLRGLFVLRRPGREWAPYAVAAVGLVSAAIIAEALWLLIHNLRAEPGIVYPMYAFSHHDTVPLNWFIPLFKDFAYSTADALPFKPFTSPAVVALPTVFNLVVIAAAFGGMFFAGWPARVRELSYSAALWMLGGAVLVTAETFLLEHVFLGYNLGPRFSLSLWPIFAVIPAVALVRRSMTVAVACVGALTTLLTLSAVAGHPLV